MSAPRHARSLDGAVYRRRRAAVAAVAVVLVGAVVFGAVVLLRTTPAAKGSGPSHLTAATFLGPDGVEARWVVQENERRGTTSWEIP
ncbi:MAG TPA: hypothetical protein VKT18_06595, partial [Acidimicrobiales bacterium]|nr:hypothetical protein [Acidimicrobiales bacterium]